MRVIPLILSALLLGFAPAACLYADDESDDNQSPLKKVKKISQRIIRLKIAEGQIQLDRESWKDKSKTEADKQVPQFQRARRFGRPKTGAEKLFDQLKNLAGANRTSMSGFNSSRTISFESRLLNAELRIGEKRLALTLTENNGDQQEVSFEDRGNGFVKITVHDSKAKRLLTFIQNKNKSVQLIHVEKGQTHSFQAASFGSLYRKERAYVESTFFPALLRSGIGAPWTSLHPKVVKAVLANLKASSAEESEQGKKLIADLDSDDFEVREAATKALSKNYAKYKNIIAQSLKGQPSPEMKMRLNTVLRENAHKGGQAQEMAMRLLKDKAYLIKLLDIVKDKGDQQTLVKALEALTGQKHGADSAAWKKWLKENP